MKTAVITGASRGIGAAIAKQLSADGYELHLCCKNNLNQMEELCSSLPGKAYCYRGDVGDSSFAASLFQKLDSLDLLVNNAGISHIGLLQDMTDTQWQELMNVNLNGVFYFTRAAIPLMLKQHAGRIINISSVWGRVGASMECAYSASKGAIDAMTRALARELAPSGISVNALACGFIDTEMNAHLSEDEKKALEDEIPAGRAGTVEEVAACVSLLAKAPCYLSAQVLTLDGAWT